jgi:hypothetical protein
LDDKLFATATTTTTRMILDVATYTNLEQHPSEEKRHKMLLSSNELRLSDWKVKEPTLFPPAFEHFYDGLSLVL